MGREGGPDRKAKRGALPKVPASLRDVGFDGYGEGRKEDFHREAASFFRRLARALELEEGSWEVRSNKAGPAVSGEVTFHHREAYLQVGGDHNVLYRLCAGLRDYSGGPNRWARKADLEGPEDILRLLAEVSPEIRAAWERVRIRAQAGPSAPAPAKPRGM